MRRSGVAVVMANFAPACISGVGKDWWNNSEVKEHFSGTSSLVQKFSPKAVMAVKDRWHAINNLELIAPIIAMQKAAHIIKTPSLKSLEAEVAVFHAMRATDGKLDEADWPDLTPFETAIHLDASSIKKILCFTRHHALRPHVPRDRGAKYYIRSGDLTRNFASFAIIRHLFFLKSSGWVASIDLKGL